MRARIPLDMRSVIELDMRSVIEKRTSIFRQTATTSWA
jgi:hypothetical protein